MARGGGEGKNGESQGWFLQNRKADFSSEALEYLEQGGQLVCISSIPPTSWSSLRMRPWQARMASVV